MRQRSDCERARGRYRGHPAARDVAYSGLMYATAPTPFGLTAKLLTRGAEDTLRRRGLRWRRRHERRSKQQGCKDLKVRTRVDRSSLWATSIPSVAALLWCAVGIAGFVAWVPIALDEGHAAPTATSSIPARPAGELGDDAPANSLDAAPARTACAGCGVIESVREMDAHGEYAAESIRSYEVTIRLQDGSRRVFSEATPRSWRSGTRVMIID